MSEQIELPARAEEKIGTSDLMRMLMSKYSCESHTVLFDIGNAVGTKYNRRADAVVIDYWQSTGQEIWGIEIKQSRSDWLRELKAVSKADPFLELVDRWWLLSADGVAKSEEVPDCWGWMTATKHGIRIQRPAKKLPHAGGKLDRLFVLELLKKASRGKLTDPDVVAAIQAANAYREQTITQRVEDARRRERQELDQLRARVEKFEKSSGMKLDDWRLGDVGVLAKAIAKMSESGYRSVTGQLALQEQTLEQLLRATREARAALPTEEVSDASDH